MYVVQHYTTCSCSCGADTSSAANACYMEYESNTYQIHACPMPLAIFSSVGYPGLHVWYNTLHTCHGT